MAKVLIVEDNADLAAGIEYNLSLEGYETCIAEDGRRALMVAEQWTPDVILLDLMLPELDGYQVLQTLRSRGVKTPVVILTASGEEADKVRGFRLDVDQYVTKHFGVLELLLFLARARLPLLSPPRPPLQHRGRTPPPAFR